MIFRGKPLSEWQNRANVILLMNGYVQTLGYHFPYIIFKNLVALLVCPTLISLYDDNSSVNQPDQQLLLTLIKTILSPNHPQSSHHHSSSFTPHHRSLPLCRHHHHVLDVSV